MWPGTRMACPVGSTGVPKEEGGNPGTACPIPGDIGRGRVGKPGCTMADGTVIDNWGAEYGGRTGMATKG